MSEIVAYGPIDVAYDIETFPNCFLFKWCWLRDFLTYGDQTPIVTYEISFRRDDRRAYFEFILWCAQNDVEMVGFNNIGFDWPVCDFVYRDLNQINVGSIYQKAMSIINGERFGSIIWPDRRIVKQIDLYLIHHFDNKAKTQSLKGLEFNMRSRNIKDMPVEVGTYLTEDQIDGLLSPYGDHDVRETARFAWISGPNVKFRRELASKVDGDVLNFNDTKIGKQMFIQRLGDDLCYDRSSGRKVPRQTNRERIVLADIIFPYIAFEQPEFQRVLAWLKTRVITETKGALTDVSATINGFTFHFGTGGIHGSVSAKAYRSDEMFAIRDVDVAALYPSIAIENGLYPAHLGPKFVEVYRGVRSERGNYAKGTPMNAGLKLANNGVYGDSNNDYSPIKDPQFTMSITINGQLLLCKLAEMLMKVPTLEIIQINTDGITFRVMRTLIPMVETIEKQWEAWSCLVLERAHYGRMFIRDVNNYIAETEPDAKGKTKVKTKGAYWYPVKFPDDISNASPSAWYKDLGAPVIQRAAEAQMLHGIPIEQYIALHANEFDFCLRAKVDRKSALFIGERQVQRITRYYVAKVGEPMTKRSPPTGRDGAFKRKNGISDAEYFNVSRELREAGTPDAWDARIHTANRSTYGEREIGFASGWVVAECNDMTDFDWSNLDRRYYIEEARKLIVS